jgi:uncharacterized membrane protein
MAEDNTIFVLQRALKILKAKVTKGSVKEFLLSHPRYPSLKSICDGLKKWNIEHYPLKLTKEEILEIEPPYIAHMGGERGQLALVEKTKNDKVTFTVNQEKEIVQSREEFSEKLSGGVIVIDTNQQSGETGYREKRQNELVKAALLPFIIIFLLLFLLYTFYSGPGLFPVQSIIPFVLFITKAIGIVASVFLILHKFKIHTKLSDKICGFSSGVDCDTVLFSDVTTIFGNINLADIGIIYFSSTLIYLSWVTVINQLWLLAVISTVSIIFPIYSIYYQGFRLRKWCPFCMVVQFVLISEFIILFPLLGLISINFVDVLRLTVLLTTVTVIWILYKSYYELSVDYTHEYYSFLRFKSNPGIFRFLIQKNGYTEIHEDQNSLIFGNPDAPVKVTAFLSLGCNPCAKAFKEIKTLLDNTDQVSINAILLISQDEQSQKLAGNLYRLYNTKGSKQAFEFMHRWYTAMKGERETLKTVSSELYKNGEFAKINNELFEKFKIHGTPMIYVNGYKLPREYKVNDIEYFTDEITSLTMERKGQEA